MPQNFGFEPEIDFQLDFQPDPVSEPQQQQSFLGGLWNTLNQTPSWIADPLKAIGDKLAHSATDFDAQINLPMMPFNLAQAKGFGAGALEGISNLLTPINIADVATGFGKAPLLRAANKGISALTAAGGIQDIAQGNPFTGIAEIAGGALGFAPRNTIAQILPQRFADDRLLPAGSINPPVAEIPTYEGPRQLYPHKELLGLPAFGETSIGSGRFTSGPAGVADMSGIFPHNMAVKGAEIWPDIGAINAANRTDVFGRPFSNPQGPLAPSLNPMIIPPGGITDGAVIDFSPNRLEHPAGGLAPNPNLRDNILAGANSEYIPDYTPRGNRRTQDQIIDPFTSTFGVPSRKPKPDIDILPSPKAAAEAQQGNKINWMNELFNLPRALKSSMDLSAPFRQGLSLAHTPQFWRSFDDMIKAWGSKDAFQAVEKSILMDKHWQLGQDSGLKLTEAFGPISKREEDFMSVIANKVPGVKQSNRAYSAFLNKLRQDTFSSLINDAEKAGLKPSENKLLTKSIAKFVNHATGRGDLKTKLPGGNEIDLERNAVLLNNLFFSPRLIKSRLHMLNPTNYLQIGKEYGMNSPEAKFMRKQYLKSTIPLFTAGATMTALGAMGLGEVESDPRSSDFGKLKIGNTRLDPYGGFQQFGTLLARLVTGQSKSTSTNNVFNLGESPVKPSLAELFLDFSNSPNRGFIGNKMHPTLAFGLDWAKLHNQKGYEIPPRVIELFTPMIAQDIIELAQEDPMLIPMLGPLAATGMGVQTY